MVGPVSFQSLQTIQNTQARFVDAGNGNFRAANEGSWKDKAVNWLKETFRPGLVKQENVQAYTAAKQAFVAAGGSKAQARHLFDGKIAEGSKFTPADIKPAWGHVFSPSDRAALTQELRDNVDIGGAKCTLSMQASPVDSTQQLADVFVGDSNRHTVTIDGTTLRDDTINTAVTNFCTTAHSKGIGKPDIEGLSKFLNQSTLGVLVTPLLDPSNALFRLSDGSARFKLPDGSGLSPTFDMAKGQSSFDVTSMGNGTYRIDYAGTTKPQPAINIDTGEMIHPDPSTSSVKLKASFLVGPDASTGAMTLLDLQDVKFSVNLFDQDGRRVI